MVMTAACGEEESGAECASGEVLHPVSGVCEAAPRGADDDGDGDGENTGDAGQGDEGEGDNGEGDEGEGDNGEGDNGEGDNGGGDDENLPPGLACKPDMDPEMDVACNFFAHSPTHLYRIDPFREIIEEIRTVPANLFDIDTHPDGTLYGITSSANSQHLYRLGEGDADWFQVGSMGVIENTNGLCIDMGGTAYITANNVLYIVDLETAEVDPVGSMGSSVHSSGDCVIDKGNILYMSSRPQGMFPSVNDDLVRIDATTAEATIIGSTGFPQIYGLTAAWNQLIGTTGQGKVILINTNTGQSEVLFDVPGNISFYGAASTPER